MTSEKRGLLGWFRKKTASQEDHPQSTPSSPSSPFPPSKPSTPSSPSSASTRNPLAPSPSSTILASPSTPSYSLLPSAPSPPPPDPSSSELAHLQLRRVMRSTSGALVAVDPSSIRILLAGMDGITQLLLSDYLEDIGFLLESCERLDTLPIHLARFGLPRLVIFESNALQSQFPLFRDRIYPQIQSASLLCLIVGMESDPQEHPAWQAWYRGAFTHKQDMDEILAQIRSLTRADV